MPQRRPILLTLSARDILFCCATAKAEIGFSTLAFSALAIRLLRIATAADVGEDGHPGLFQ